MTTPPSTNTPETETPATGPDGSTVDPESPEAPEGAQAGTSEPEAPSTEEIPAEDPAETPEGETEADSALSLEDARAALTKVRKSEAGYRTRLRDLEAQLAEAKTPEQVKEITDKLTSDNATEARELLVENVALKHGLPDELASALKGDTREELETHAKVLAKFAPANESQDPPVVGGGLDPNTPPEGSFDPHQNARKHSTRNRRWS